MHAPGWSILLHGEPSTRWDAKPWPIHRNLQPQHKRRAKCKTRLTTRESKRKIHLTFVGASHPQKFGPDLDCSQEGAVRANGDTVATET